MPPNPRTPPRMLTFLSLKLETEKRESQHNFRTEVASRTLGRGPHCLTLGSL